MGLYVLARFLFMVILGALQVVAWVAMYTWIAFVGLLMLIVKGVIWLFKSIVKLTRIAIERIKKRD